MKGQDHTHSNDMKFKYLYLNTVGAEETIFENAIFKALSAYGGEWMYLCGCIFSYCDSTLGLVEARSAEEESSDEQRGRWMLVGSPCLRACMRVLRGTANQQYVAEVVFL